MSSIASNEKICFYKKLGGPPTPFKLNNSGLSIYIPVILGNISLLLLTFNPIFITAVDAEHRYSNEAERAN